MKNNEWKKGWRGFIAFDFDGVIATYKRPFVIDRLGKPQKEIIDTIKYFYNEGYYILIFTGRLETPVFIKWLAKHKVPYDGVNINPLTLAGTNNGKPFFNVVVDDKAVNYHWKYNKKTSTELINEIEVKLKWAEK